MTGARPGRTRPAGSRCLVRGGSAAFSRRARPRAPRTSTFDGHNDDDFTPYIFRTADFGATWTPIAGDLPGGHGGERARRTPAHPPAALRRHRVRALRDDRRRSALVPRRRQPAARPGGRRRDRRTQQRSGPRHARAQHHRPRRHRRARIPRRGRAHRRVSVPGQDGHAVLRSAHAAGPRGVRIFAVPIPRTARSSPTT